MKVDEIEIRHPNWLRENTIYVVSTENEEEVTKREILLVTSCTLCGMEMGEHRFKGKSFICPVIKHTHRYTVSVGCHCGDTGMGAADACEEGLIGMIEKGGQYKVISMKQRD